MLTAWRRNARLPAAPQEARMWLFGIAKYTLLNHQRGRRRHVAAAEALKQSVAVVRPRDETESLDRREDVRRAIAELPSDQAEIIRLVHWDGFTVSEAARLIGTPEPTVRGRYNGALVRLRTQLQTASDTPSGALADP
jgi:RNA polymerase sigma factor (sigma-70 family)